MQACISIVLNRKTIVALQLDVTPASVARSLLIAPKLKLKQGHIRPAPSSVSNIPFRTCISTILTPHHKHIEWSPNTIITASLTRGEGPEGALFFQANEALNLLDRLLRSKQTLS
jgi:hypothetical protein